jgi:hypothetical protein
MIIHSIVGMVHIIIHLGIVLGILLLGTMAPHTGMATETVIGTVITIIIGTIMITTTIHILADDTMVHTGIIHHLPLMEIQAIEVIIQTTQEHTHLEKPRANK